MDVQRIRHIRCFPLLPLIRSVGASAFHKRHKQRLVIVAAQSGRFIILDQRALAAALTAGADLQRLRRLHYKGLVVPAHTISGIDRGRCLQRADVSGVLAMVLIDRRRHVPARRVGEVSSPYPMPLACAECSVQKPAAPITQGGCRGFPPGELPRHPPSHLCGCRPGRFRQTQPDAPAPSAKAPATPCHGRKPCGVYPDTLRTQIVFFRHSRLQNLRQVDAFSALGDSPVLRIKYPPCETEIVCHDFPGVCPSLRSRSMISYPLTDRFLRGRTGSPHPCWS